MQACRRRKEILPTTTPVGTVHSYPFDTSFYFRVVGDASAMRLSILVQTFWAVSGCFDSLPFTSACECGMRSSRRWRFLFSFSRNQVKLSSTPKKNRWRSLTGRTRSWFRVYVFACARLDDCFMQREIEDYDGFSKDMRCEEVVMWRTTGWIFFGDWNNLLIIGSVCLVNLVEDSHVQFFDKILRTRDLSTISINVIRWYL